MSFLGNSGNISADGNTDAFIWHGGRGQSGENLGHFVAHGTFGGGTLTLQFSIDGGTTWAAVGDDTTITAAGGGQFSLPKGTQLRINTASSTSPDVDWKVSQ